MRQMYIDALERAKKDRAELQNAFFQLAIDAGKEGDEEHANDLLRYALDQQIIVEGLERNIDRLKRAF